MNENTDLRIKNPAHQHFGIFDATNLVIGGMIGSGIFMVSADIARTLEAPGWFLMVWLIAGGITILGALSYAELAAMLPFAGGQYVFLREAFSPMCGFLFGWTMFLVIQTGSIAAVAVAFTKFLGLLWPGLMHSSSFLQLGGWSLTIKQLLAIAIIFGLTVWNSRGLSFGKLITNIFTVAKVCSLLLMILIGFWMGQKNPQVIASNLANFWGNHALNFWPLLGSAMVGALFALDGWANLTFIAHETKKPEVTLPVSLILGTTLVTLLYFLVNYAFLNVLSMSEIQQAENDMVGTVAAQSLFGDIGRIAMTVMILISVFGCLNGMILSGPRLYYAMARDQLFFPQAAQLNTVGVPAYALWMQLGWSSLLALSGSYSSLLDYVIFATLLFYVLAVWGLMRLRHTQPQSARPYRTWGYPVLPLLYIILASVIMLDLLIMKPSYTWPGLFIVMSGVPVYWLWQRNNPV